MACSLEVAVIHFMSIDELSIWGQVCCLKIKFKHLDFPMRNGNLLTYIPHFKQEILLKFLIQLDSYCSLGL